ncbi:unnamed protein product, partial [marine sediment metagenome]
MDIVFDVIKSNVSSWVVSIVNVLDDRISVLLDFPDVVCDCHNVTPKRLARK